MAASLAGDGQRGSYCTQQPTVVSHASAPTGGSDPDSDDPLLDISEIDILNKTLPFRGMDRNDGLSSIENVLSTRTDVPDSLTLPERQQPPQPQEQAIYTQAKDHNATFGPATRQKRLNPFDVAKRDVWQTLEYSVGEQTRQTATEGVTVSNQLSFDPFDQLNFGDPTFVNSYSSAVSTSASQSPARNTGPSRLKKPATELKGSFPSHGLNLQFEPSLSHRNNPNVPQVNLSHPYQYSSNAGPPVLAGFERKSGSDIQFSSTSNRPIASAQRLSSTTDLLPGLAVLTNERPADTINKHQDYIEYPGKDLIIRDYTSSWDGTRNIPSSPKYPDPISNDGRKQRGSSQSNALFSNQNKLTVKPNGTGQGCLDDKLPVTSGQLLNVVATMGDQRRVMVDAFGSNRFGMNITSVGDSGGGPRESFYSLDGRGGMHNLEEEGGHSLWEDESESGFLESAPLLDSETTNKRGTVTASSLNNQIGNPFEASQRVPAVCHKTGAKTEVGTSQQVIANRQVPNGDFMARGKSLKLNVQEGNHNGITGHRSSTRGADNHSSTFHSAGIHRNAYGELSPLPQFMEQDLAGRAGEPHRGAYRHCHKRRMMSLTDKLARRQLVSVVVLCLLFMVGEGVGGFLANSLALFTDVLHLASDLISFIISLLAMWLANKPATRRMSFGYHRAEVLGAMFSVFIIWLVSGVLCYIAVDRILHQHYMDVKPDEMLITASLGVLFNIVMGLVLHSEMCCGHAHSHNKFGHGHSHAATGHGHSHGNSHVHGHSHEHSKDDLLDVATTQREGSDGLRQGFEYQRLEHQTDGLNHQMRDDSSLAMGSVAEDSSDEFHECEEEETIHKHKNINVRAAFIHVVGDIIQSLGVLIAALIIKFTDDEKYRLADPICTFLFSILVLITTITVLRDAVLVVMEGVPRDVSMESLKKELSVLDGVVTVHSLHIWALTLDRNALSVHLAVENAYIHDQVLSAATKLIQDRHHFFHSTIQVELYDEAAMKSCKECTEWK